MSSANPTSTAQVSADVHPLRKGLSAPSNDLGVLQITVGRAPDNDVQVSGPTVSKTHAHFTLVRGELFLADQGSSNGTTLDGEVLAPKRRMSVGAGIVEIFFGDEQLFLFDVDSLWTYVEFLRDRRTDRPSGEGRLADILDQDPNTPPSLPSRRDEGVVVDDEALIPSDVGLVEDVPAEGEPPPETDSSSTEPTSIYNRELLETHIGEAPLARQSDAAAEAEAKWEKGLAALEQLFPKLKTVAVQLSTQPDLLTIYRYAEGVEDGFAGLLTVLKGMRPIVTSVGVAFRESSFELKVYER
jgi:hypothetical protein